MQRKPPVVSVMGRPVTTRVPVSKVADQNAFDRPIHHGDSVQVARAQHDVVGFDFLQHDWDRVGRVGEVSIHLEDAVCAQLERFGQSVPIGGSESALLGAVEHVDPARLGPKIVGDLAGFVRGVVVDDEHLDPGILLQHGRHQQRKILRLVVGGNYDKDPGHERVDLSERA